METKKLQEIIDIKGIDLAQEVVVTKIAIDQNAEAEFYIDAPDLGAKALETIRKRILAAYPFFSGIKMIFNVRKETTVSLAKAVERRKKDIIARLSEEKIHSVLFLSTNWSYDQNVVTIYAVDEQHLNTAQEEGLPARIGALIEEYTNIGCEVKMVLKAIDKTAVRKPIDLNAYPKPDRPTAKKSSGGKAAGTAGKVLYGSGPVKRSGLIPLESVYKKDIGSRVVIEGKVFYTEMVEGFRAHIKVMLTNKETSVELRLSVDKNELKEVYATIKKCTKKHVVCVGKLMFDEYLNDRFIRCYGLQQIKVHEYVDDAKEKRVELHCHTQYSERDATSKIDDLFIKLDEMGHKAVAITDHGGVYAYPEAYALGQKYGIKVLYGVEAYLVDDESFVLTKPTQASLDEQMIVVDVETTGLSAREDEIIEIGAVKIKGGKIIDRFSTFVKPGRLLPPRITELTGITDSMLADAPDIAAAIADYDAFCADTELICTHNASFDSAFIDKALLEAKLNTRYVYIDTLHLCRRVYTELKTYRLSSVAKHLKINMGTAHRALDDATTTAKVMNDIYKRATADGLEKVQELKTYCQSGESDKKARESHCTVLVKNRQGLKDLYRLISQSNIDHFYRRPKIFKSVLRQYKENLLIGTACDAGELFKAFLMAMPEEELDELAAFYDYFEIQPTGNSYHLVDDGILKNAESIMAINREIIALARRHKKPYVATGDVHFTDRQDSIYRSVLMHMLKFDDADKQAPLYLRTTKEMLKEFEYLDQKTAYEAVVTNTARIAELVEEEIRPIPEGSYPPAMEGVEEKISSYINNTAYELYGEALPEIVVKSIEKEVGVIEKYNYSVLYYLAQKTVHKAYEDGYLVGSRGSVGSSFAAMLLGITEVNPLPPHYRCPNCKQTEFADSKQYGVGVDLPDKDCPECGTEYAKEGFDIPFECFLGFEGDKEPDIDLNFASDYQSRIHKYVEEMLGADNVFRSGTISKTAQSLARSYVRKYVAAKEIELPLAEQKRLELGCMDLKSTTGQHPGGLIVLPEGMEIYDFTPVQYPANDAKKGVVTTSFDYDAIKGRLLKLDLLAHDDPTMINYLQRLTGVDAKQIRLDDKRVMSLFTSVEALKLEDENILTTVGTYGVPEFGTKFVREMLIQAKPQCFDDLIRISGLSHGTDVWINNAAEYIKNGTATIKNVISTRDSIMLYLIQMGMQPKLAFDIMERVRKGKGLKEEDEREMKALGVENWYIESCKKIKYMFPKAHAAAYVMMGFRVAYYKVYHPLAYYCAYFSIRSKDFDAAVILRGKEAIRREIKKYYEIKNLTATQKDTLTTLEIALEMLCRGYAFENITLGKSHYNDFIIEENKLVLPYKVLEGAGEKVTTKIYEESRKKAFSSIEDFKKRTGASAAIVDQLVSAGVLAGMQLTDQISFF